MNALAVCHHRGVSVASAAPLAVPKSVNAETFRKSAEIVNLKSSVLPKPEAFRKQCADLIERTFPGSSRHAICKRAARETGSGSPDKFLRILTDDTRAIDAYMLRVVLHLAAARGVAIPPALAVWVTA